VSDEIQVVEGPLAPGLTNRLVYYVTLANGHIVTNPDQFGEVRREAPAIPPQPLPPAPQAPQSPTSTGTTA
jgi:hypothetical protein